MGSRKVKIEVRKEVRINLKTDLNPRMTKAHYDPQNVVN